MSQWDIWAQRIDSTGSLRWQTFNGIGVAVCTAAGFQLNVKLTSDGDGGAIMTWQDARGGNSHIFAQRLSPNGAPQWTPDGVTICTAANSRSNPVITSDLAGGAILAWSDERNGAAGYVTADIYAQRLSANGVAQWAVDGVAMCAAPDGQLEPAIASDAQGGAFIAWRDHRNNGDPQRTMNTDIYAQRTSGLRGSLTFYHQIPNLPYFQAPFLLATSGSPAKICADGSSATLISYKVDSGNVAPVKLRIKEDPQGASPSVYGSFALEPSHSHPPDSVVFRYNHPKTPPPASMLDIQMTLEVVDSVTGIVKKSNSIGIYRAPVLMVHGLWSDPSTFGVMRTSLASQGWPKPLLGRAIYTASHSRSYSSNSWVIPIEVHALLALARRGKYSAGKVDVVGHSMGGILARLYLQGGKYQNNLNRLITLNTPHSGSQAADWLIRKPELGGILNFFNDVYDGAIADLRVEGPAIRDSLNGSLLNAHVTPSHAILTVADVQDAPGLGWVELLWALAEQRYRLPITDLLGRLYNYRPSDLVVADLSQQGGLSTFSLASNHQIHTGSTSNSDVISRVIQLLNTSTDDLSAFSMDGFHPPLLDYAFKASNIE
ncbi:MAG: esterase/lipase family protein [bacterium]